jgi:hypothetical protein
MAHAGEKERLFFIDNLRILLIVLVIPVHLAITYGAPVGDWYYKGRYYERQAVRCHSVFGPRYFSLKSLIQATPRQGSLFFQFNY